MDKSIDITQYPEDTIIFGRKCRTAHKKDLAQIKNDNYVNYKNRKAEHEAQKFSRKKKRSSYKGSKSFRKKSNYTDSDRSRYKRD